MRTPAVVVALAIVVLSGSAALRLTGLDWLLPKLAEPDAHIPVQVRMMEDAVAEPDAVPDWGAYPHLVARLTQLLTPREDWSPPAAGTPVETLLARAAWPILRVRLVVALLSLLAVPAVFLLARRWLDAGWSWLAAALMGTSLLALHFSGEARAHGAAAGLMALAVLACVRLRWRPDAGSYLLAGLGVGAALACLQSGLATLIPLLVAHAGVVRAHGRRKLPLLLVPLACVALALLAFYPFVFETTTGVDAARLEVEGGVLGQAKHLVFLGLFNGRGFVLLGRQLWTWEPALALGAALGAGVWLATRRGPDLLGAQPGERSVVLAFALSYALAVGLYQRSYERFLLPLIPFLAVLAAWGVARACAALRSPRARRALAGVLSIGLLAVPTAAATRLAALRLRPDTIDLAAAWVREHVVPSGPSVVVSRSFALPLVRTPASQYADAGARPDSGLAWLGYQHVALRDRQPSPAWHLPWLPFRDIDDLRAQLARGLRSWLPTLPGELCVNEVSTEPRNIPEVAAITSVLRAECETLARFTPDGESPAWEAPLGYQDEVTGPLPPMAWRVLHAERLGPVLEIYRVPRAAAPDAPR